MRRNGTGGLAAGAILGGAAIGIAATLAFIGGPLDRGASEEVAWVSPAANVTTHSRWTVSAPGRRWSYSFEYRPISVRCERLVTSAPRQ